MKIKKIEIPLYYGELIIVKAKNWKEVNKKFGTNAEKGFEAVFFKDDKKSGRTRYVVAYVGKKLSNDVIAHETVHVVNSIFIDRKMQLDPYNDEPQAYLTGWVFGQIKKFVK